jgi:excisionase family DNA binding protein
VRHANYREDHVDSILLRPEEVREALGLSRTVVYGMIASGELPVVRVGRAVRVPRDGLERWVRERTAGGGADQQALQAGDQPK